MVTKLFFFLLFIWAMDLHSQVPDLDFDTTKTLVLEYKTLQDDKAFGYYDESDIISNVHISFFVNMHNHHKSVYFDSLKNDFYFYNTHPECDTLYDHSGSVLYPLPSIHSIPRDHKFYLKNQKNVIWELTVIDDKQRKSNLSKMKIFNHLSTNNCIGIRLTLKRVGINPTYCSKVDIKKWPNYSQLLNSKILKEFKITGYSRESLKRGRKYIELINAFKQLEIVDYDPLLDIKNFENIKVLKEYNSDLFSHSIFDHRIVLHRELKIEKFTMECLPYFPNYAENYFLLKNLSFTQNEHPYYLIDSVIRTKNLNHLPEDVDFKITWGEIDSLLIISKDSIPFGIGKIRNRQIAGLWEICSLDFSKDLNKKLIIKCYEINFDHPEQIIFPQDGSWVYYYENGRKAIEGTFKNGKKEGNWYFYYPDGELEKKISFHKDKVGVVISYFNESEKRVYNSKKYGLVVVFIEDSKIVYMRAERGFDVNNEYQKLCFYSMDHEPKKNKSYPLNSPRAKRFIRHQLKKLQIETTLNN